MAWRSPQQLHPSSLASKPVTSSHSLIPSRRDGNSFSASHAKHPSQRDCCASCAVSAMRWPGQLLTSAHGRGLCDGTSRISNRPEQKYRPPQITCQPAASNFLQWSSVSHQLPPELFESYLTSVMGVLLVVSSEDDRLVIAFSEDSAPFLAHGVADLVSQVRNGGEAA